MLGATQRDSESSLVPPGPSSLPSFGRAYLFVCCASTNVPLIRLTYPFGCWYSSGAYGSCG